MEPDVRSGEAPGRGPGRPRRAETDRNIGEAALRLLHEAGPSGVTVEAVAAESGVAKTTIYRRHADRESVLRAALAAFWLRQLGYETYVLPDIESWPADWRLPVSEPPPHLVTLPAISAGEAIERAQAGDLLLDLRGSLAYRAGHLPGAAWSIRPRLPAVAGRRVLLAGDEAATALASRDLAEFGAVSVHRVAGDATEWRAAGLALDVSPDDPADAGAIDYLFLVHDRHDGNLDAARRYLVWELGLVAQLDADERGEYRLDTLDLRAGCNVSASCSRSSDRIPYPGR